MIQAKQIHGWYSLKKYSKSEQNFDEDEDLSP